jgi:PAS domain S-box-containing protein
MVFMARRDIPLRWVFLAFGLFILACGGTHFVETVTVWVPVFVFSAAVKIVTAAASVSTAIALPFTVPQATALACEARVSESRREELEIVLEQRNQAQEALRQMNAQLEELVKARTAELLTANASLRDELRERAHLEISLARLAAIVEYSNDAIFDKDLQGIVRSWNRGAATLYGYTAEEMVGKHVSILIPHNRREEINDIMQRLMRGERIEHYETERVTKAGFLIDISLTVSPVFDADGKIVGASAISRDVTSAKRAQDALRESEARYRLLFESNPMPMWIFDQRTLRFLAVNQAAVQHYGYSRQEFLRMTILDIRPAEDVSDVIRDLSRPIRGLQRKEMLRHRKKDGTLIDVEITACDLSFPTPDSELILAQDVTETVQNERKLRHSEERFSKAFRSGPFGITISTEFEGRYLDANPAFLSMMGYDRDQVIGRTVEDLAVWAEPWQRDLMLKQLEGPKPTQPLEVRFRSRSGKVHLIELAAERIYLDDRPCVLAITHDVTEARQMERQFLQAQKMEAVGRLAGGIAHDFNNVLGVIIGYSEMAITRFKLDDALQKHLLEIRKAGDRAAGLVRQLLAFTRQQPQLRRVLSLNAIVQNLSHMLSHMIGEDIRLTFNPAEPLGSVCVDLGHIEQVLLNLVVNARDAMPRGGQLIIETSNIFLDDAYLGQQGPIKPGAYVLLAVSDTGSGMGEAVLSRIFEPFFTTKEVGKGTGLGLSTVWGIVNQNNGYISVYSNPGYGTTFKVYLPRVDQPAEDLTPRRNDVVAPSGNETVLVVEDHDTLRALAVNVLEMKGYKVLSASSGSSAVDVAQHYDGEIKLMLSDIIMPGMTGPDLAAAITTRRPGMKVLYMSGYANTLMSQEGGIAADAPILTKPFSSLELLTRVRSVIEGK